MDRIDKKWSSAKQELIEAAGNAGVDASILVKIAGFESTFDPHARPIGRSSASNKVTQFDGVKAISSAYGYGQFIDSTWSAMIHKYGEKYGIAGAGTLSAGQTNAPEIRNDSRVQAAILAEFTRENVAKGEKLGGADPDANVYAFHNLGDRDATKFLSAMKADPNQRVDAVLSAAVVRGNPSLYGDGSRSLSEAYSIMGRHMDRYNRYAMEAIQGHAVDDINTAQHSTGQHGISRSRDPLIDGQLRYGEHGPAVVALQRDLNQLGYRDALGRKLTVDGDFGHSTRSALIGFQQANDLIADGIAGPETLKEIRLRSLDTPHRHEEPAIASSRAKFPTAMLPAAHRREIDMEDRFVPGRTMHHATGPISLGYASDSAHGPKSSTSPNPSGRSAASGPFDDPYLDRAFAALMAGDSYQLDRIAAEFTQSPEGQRMVQQGDELYALLQLQEQQQLEEQQAQEQAPLGPGLSR